MSLEERIPYTSSEEIAVLRPRMLPGRELSSTLFEKILIPVEFDSDSHALTSLATVLASRFHSQFLLVHTVQHETMLAREPEMRDERRSRLKRVADALSDAGAQSVETFLREGSPAHHLEELAQEHAASVVLMLERGEPTAGHAWFGTLTQRLARRMTTPLLVVKQDSAATLSPILCVVDFSAASRLALKRAIETAREAGSPLTVLHVVPEPLPFPLVEGPIWQGCSTAGGASAAAHADAGAYGQSGTFEQGRRLRGAKADLEEFLKAFDLSDIRYDMVVTGGTPVVEILMMARARKSGIIFIGSEQKSGLVHVVSQSPAETLAETSDVPVLIVRAASGREAGYGGYVAAVSSIPLH
jgi:universal stress protein E